MMASYADCIIKLNLKLCMTELLYHSFFFYLMHHLLINEPYFRTRRPYYNLYSVNSITDKSADIRAPKQSPCLLSHRLR